MEVVNDTIKKLRETLEKAGQWNDTTLVISSDHWWRAKKLEDFKYLPEEERQKAVNDRRVPLIIKFAGEETRMSYEPAVNTVITKEIILGVFKGKIKNSNELVLWLNDIREMYPELINLQPETVNQPSAEIH